MSKVPVGKSIAHAYEFLLGRIFQIIGTAWLPALLYAVGYFYWLQNSATWLAPLTQDRGLLIAGILASAGFFVLALVVRAVIGISLTQEALGVRNDLALAHFVIGPRELRLFFAQIRLLLVIAVLEIVAAAVVVLGLGAAVKFGSAIAGLPAIAGQPLVVVAAILVALILYIALVLAVLKLSFFLTAVASVEHRASVRRGWQLAGGSGWRILLVLLGVFLPVFAIVCGAVYFLAGPDLVAAMQATDPAARGHALMQFYANHAMLLSAVAGILSVVGGALMAGATATAYRTVTGHELEEPEDDAALVAPLLAPAESHEDHGHEAHEDHGHGGHDESHGGHDDHGHGGNGHGHDDHGHDGGHGHDDHGHDDKGHDDHGHGNGHDDHGHGEKAHGHDDHGHGDHGHGDKGHDDHGDHGHGDKAHGHDDHGHGGHGDHGNGHDDHGHDDHGHDDHGHGEKAHGHDDHGHDNHGHDDHGHGGHEDHGHDDKKGHGHGDHGHGSHHHHARAA